MINFLQSQISYLHMAIYDMDKGITGVLISPTSDLQVFDDPKTVQTATRGLSTLDMRVLLLSKVELVLIYYVHVLDKTAKQRL